MENQRKCQFAVCGCSAPDGSLYCSDDCRQAATQGIPRDFCQCAHGGCEKPVHHLHQDDALGFADAISSAPGWLSIEYSSYEDLRRQLLLVTQALDQRFPKASLFPTETIPRRSVSAELDTPARKAQSA